MLKFSSQTGNETMLPFSSPRYHQHNSALSDVPPPKEVQHGHLLSYRAGRFLEFTSRELCPVASRQPIQHLPGLLPSTMDKQPAGRLRNHSVGGVRSRTERFLSQS